MQLAGMVRLLVTTEEILVSKNLFTAIGLVSGGIFAYISNITNINLGGFDLILVGCMRSMQ